MTTQRLQKILSQAGLGSRREMERFIEQGSVKVNGKVAQIGDSADEHARISFKGKLIQNPLKTPLRTRVLIYHKPIGEISSREDPNHSKTVFDHLPPLKKGRWIQIGRLDINTSGLLLFTNNGDLANYLMHPKYELEREYAVRVFGEVSEAAIQSLLKGVELEDGNARFKTLSYRGGKGKNAWYHVVLTEGRNREVRRLWESQGVEVSRLMRIRFGSIAMPRYLSRGNYQELSPDHVHQFLEAIAFKP